MFLNPRDFPFTAALESRWSEIRGEFMALAPGQLMPWPETDLYNRGWEVFGLWAMGRKLESNCGTCPRTAEAVESIPGLTTAGFSLLAPGARIRPHVGYTNSVLRCHLGVIVPGGCRIQVGDETREWEQGKCLVFDDTVLHSACNESDAARIVLLIDFVREGRRFDPAVSDEFFQLIRTIDAPGNPATHRDG
jgi:aspartyl/asparaginyl beta-hydroxylase (cupin superfamily)